MRASTPAPVARLRRPDEVVVGDLESPVELPVPLDDPVGEGDAASMPWAAAAFSMFCPCSSVPVRNQVFSPISRWKRVITSVTTVE